MNWWNWHKRWPFNKWLCKLGRHDFDHARVDGDDIVLRCFYCWQGRRCIGAALAPEQQSPTDM